MATKSFKITTTSQISDVTNCVISTYGSNFYALPELQTNLSNYTSRRNGYGDSVMAYPDGFHIDNEYIISVGWGDGFAVHSIADNGTISEVYYDLRPANSYQNYTSIAVNKTRKIAIVGNYVYDNLTKYDFSEDWENQPTKTVMTESSNNLPSDEVGYSYANGLAFAGDWLYIVPDDKTTTGVFRWNVVTETTETLTVASYSAGLQYGWVQYDEQTDRIYMGDYGSNVGLLVVTDASSDLEAVARSINHSSLGQRTNRVPGVYHDPNNRNHIWVGSSYRMGKIDITNCILDPSDQNYTNIPVKLVPSGTPDYMYNDSPWFIGTGLWGIYGIEELDMLYLVGDRGYGQDVTTGFFDQESGKCAFIPNSPSSKQDHNNVGSEYSYTWKAIYSPNNTKYWLGTGYGGDGNSFTVWPSNISPVLQNSWEFETSIHMLDNNENVTQIIISDTLNLTIPTNTSCNFYVTNNNGSTWETYGSVLDKVHEFESEGNSVKIKFVASGLNNTSPFIVGESFIFHLNNDRVNKTIKNRIHRTKGFKLKSSRF